MIKWLVVLAMLLLSGLSEAAEIPQPGELDPRIQTIAYDPDQVALLRGTLGYQFMVEFGLDEKIETVSIGDSLSWQVTPNRKATVLFLKPIRRSTTNLTVLTNLRRYAFELRVQPERKADPILFIARMTYPAPVQATPVPSQQQAELPPRVANEKYAVSGAAQVQPVRIFDDGSATYFEWAKDRTLPAIFAVSDDGTESLVNTGVRGQYVVVDQIASEFRLRSGKEVATVTNRMMAESGKGHP